MISLWFVLNQNGYPPRASHTPDMPTPIAPSGFADDRVAGSGAWCEGPSRHAQKCAEDGPARQVQGARLLLLLFFPAKEAGGKVPICLEEAASNRGLHENLGRQEQLKRRVAADSGWNLSLFFFAAFCLNVRTLTFCQPMGFPLNHQQLDF